MEITVDMGTEAPSWADQWGAGGIGAVDEVNTVDNNKDVGSKKKGTGSSAGLSKAKAVAVGGAQKVKNGTTMGIKWIKNKVQKKNSNENSHD
ncbi:hypothetical protein AgCh_020225 [Apium graveolens]